MHLFSTKNALQTFLESLRKGRKIGFAPTMGALHEGHLSLLKKSLLENDFTVLSIFVNPTQFNNLEDLHNYPRTLENDLKLVGEISSNIIVYAPSVEDIYEGKMQSFHYDFDGLEFQMEGKHRPGHFDGVGTIVKKLFEIVLPENAYFGEKDFQQLQIVKKLVEKHHLNVTIIGCPIYREPNGLAMSSRNERLSEKARKEAAIIFQTLTEAKQFFQTHTVQETITWVESIFNSNPNFTLEYFTVANEQTLVSIDEKIASQKYRGFIAVFIENIRLIDNLPFY